MPKQPRKSKPVKTTASVDKPAKRRFKAGVVARRECRKAPRLVLTTKPHSKKSVERVIRACMPEKCRIQAEAIDLIDKLVKNHILDIMNEAKKMSDFSKRTTMMDRDLDFILEKM